MPVLPGSKVWTETSQADFADGVFNQNIYASNHDGGSVEFTSRWDLNNDGYLDIFSSSSSALSIYWGSGQGFSINNKTSFPSPGTGGCEGADLNYDGWPEFIASYGNNDPRIVIYWGSSSGYSYSNNTSIVHPVTNEALYVADLNKDGYLDLLGGTTINYSTSSIYWGGPNGYSPSNRTDLPSLYGAHNFEIADLNKDGFYDIIIVNNNAAYNYIYWGTSNGYSTAHRISLNLPGVATPHGTTVADFNQDGWLDIVFTAVFSDAAYIFWGSANGYSVYQTLNPGSCYGGSSAVDFNGDGYVDIVFLRGRSGNKPVVYWGSATGFSESSKMEFGSYISGSGGLVADLNGDNALDVYIENYEGNSLIFWGPNYTSSFTIPTGGDHHAMFREPGNAYDRKFYEDYSSSILNAGAFANWDKIEWDAAAAPGFAVFMYLRTGNTPIPDDSWSDWLPVDNGGIIPDQLNAQYLQYRASLTYTKLQYLPALNEVRISYNPANQITATISIKPEVINLKSHGRFTAFITLPSGYDPADIDISTVQCVGAPAISGEVTPIGLIAKFNVDDIKGVEPGPAVEFLLTGQLLDGTFFRGVDTVKVICPQAIKLDNTPNPFVKRTLIIISNNDPTLFNENSGYAAKIYNLAGASVRSFPAGIISNGVCNIDWDRRDDRGKTVPSGVYILMVGNGNSEVSKKIVVVD